MLRLLLGLLYSTSSEREGQLEAGWALFPAKTSPSPHPTRELFDFEVDVEKQNQTPSGSRTPLSQRRVREQTAAFTSTPYWPFSFKMADPLEVCMCARHGLYVKFQVYTDCQTNTALRRNVSGIMQRHSMGCSR